MLLDEPFRGLDRTVKELVMQQVLAQSREKLVLLVTHDREEAFLLSDTILFLQGGPLHITDALTLSGKSPSERDKLLRESLS